MGCHGLRVVYKHAGCGETRLRLTVGATGRAQVQEPRARVSACEMGTDALNKINRYINKER